MGSNLTKFKKIIELKRDENEAIFYYRENTRFKQRLDVNCSINNAGDTLIHLVCKYGMISLLE
jgi:cell shape-determining protein MreC